MIYAILYAICALVHVHFPCGTIMCCRFLIDQTYCRKIYTLALSSNYCNTETEGVKWLTNFFALLFLHLNEIKDSCVKDLFIAALYVSRCEQPTDCVLKHTKWNTLSRRVFYRKHELHTIRELLCLPRLFSRVRVAHLFRFLGCPFMFLYVLSSMLSCPLRFPHKNDVRFVFSSSCL